MQVGALVGRVAPGKDLLLQVLRAPDRVSSRGRSEQGPGQRGGPLGACSWLHPPPPLKSAAASRHKPPVASMQLQSTLRTLTALSTLLVTRRMVRHR